MLSVWKRGETIFKQTRRTSGKRLRVFFIDHGRIENFAASSVRLLHQVLLSYLGIARECTLNHNFHGATWSKEDTNFFNEITKQSPMKMKILSQYDGILEIDLEKLNSSAGAASIFTVRERLFLAQRPASTDQSKKKSVLPSPIAFPSTEPSRNQYKHNL